MKKNNFKIGIDMGGTKIESVILDNKNSLIFKKRIETPQTKNHTILLNELNWLLEATKKEVHNLKYSIGIGIPGSITKKNIVYNSTIPCQNNLNVQSCIEQRIKEKINIENDANCFCLAESLLGSGEKFQIVIGLIIGTGVGGGISINKKIFTGGSNTAGEFGHTVVDPNGPKCFCGKKGCANTFISGTAIEKELRYLEGKNKTAKEFFKQKKFNFSEKKIINKFKKYYLILIKNIIASINPNAIILGGGVSNFKKIYDEYNLELDQKNTKIFKNKLGDSAGSIGAALLKDQ